jgi:NAD(P)-dependent dehydrogenase (short-subunit alcohol dehydrogenase family)
VADAADYPEDVFERVLPVNVRGPFHVAKQALGAMRPGGSLVSNSMIPLGRHAAPGEVAQRVAFLVSDESAFMTGATIPLDGGMSV